MQVKRETKTAYTRRENMNLNETLWTVASQAPLSVEFSRQEYWSG